LARVRAATLQNILNRIGPFVSILTRSSARTHTPYKKRSSLNTQF
jgi:hypothetical protein